jgi:hypothetical protein
MNPETKEAILSLFESSGLTPKSVYLEKKVALPDAKYNSHPPRTKGILGYGTGKVKVGEPVVVYGEALDSSLIVREFTTSLVAEVLDEDFMACDTGPGTTIIKFRTCNSVYVLTVEEG